ncbi:MAG: acyltransferase family protein [Deltaproteobacteria bacterium]|nr:acyltransferase family protein [Deltaproteobacteria bacterium]
MDQSNRHRVIEFARRVLGDERVDLILNAPFNDLGFGYDQFGMERESILLGYLLARPLYQSWFRAESTGHENLPARGRAMVVPNHSGVLPIDGLLIYIDIMEKAPNPRLMRGIIEKVFSGIPSVGTFMQRCGQVTGTRYNFEQLLESEELVTVFPEGAKGPGKPFSDRYKLVNFNVGFVELAIRHKTPIIPTSVIGGEEQYPALVNIKPLAKALGVPYFPITPQMLLLPLPLWGLPLPTKYRIRYGAPIELHREYPEHATEDPELMRRIAREIQDTVQEMVNEDLAGRESVWFG